MDLSCNRGALVCEGRSEKNGQKLHGGQGWLDTERIFYEKLPHNGDTIREKRPPNSYLSPVLSPWALSEADYPGVEPRTQ